MPFRRLPLKKLYNTRELGGFPTEDGNVTRFGVFLRSEAPVDLPPSDKEYLLRYGVDATMDFRSSMETDQSPSDFREMLPYYHCPFFNEAAMSGTRPPKGPPKKIGWGEQYIQMVETSTDWAHKVLQIAAEDKGVLLYHCTTGKDRTGLMTCYLLSIAGVPQADIVADYCVSELFLEPVYARMRAQFAERRPAGKREGQKQDGPGGPPLMDDSFFHTPAIAMQTVLQHLDENYGGVVPYLRHIGIEGDVLSAIREKLVEKV